MRQVGQHRENLIRTRLLTSEKEVLIKRGSAALLLQLVSSFSQLPAQLPCRVVQEPSAQKMSYLIWFSQVELVSWQAPRPRSQ